MARRYATPADVGAAPAVHNHDGVYSPVGHNHDAAYSALGHKHPVGDITATGTPDSTTYLRGDGVWVAPPAAPAATETAAGIVEHATQAEVQAGTAGNLVATAARLKAELDRRFASPAWIAPTLLNAWVNYGTPYATAGYYKTTDGFVVVKGMVKGGTPGATSVAFTLPVGYRPLETHPFSGVASTSAYVRVDVEPDGDVVIIQGSTTWTSLATIVFRAEQ